MTSDCIGTIAVVLLGTQAITAFAVYAVIRLLVTGKPLFLRKER